MLSSNGSLVVTIKPKTEYIFHAAATQYFFLRTTKNCLNKCNVFFEDLLPHIISVL